MGDYRVHVIDEADFAGMRDEWDVLLSSSASDNVFLTWEWLFHWWKHFKKPDSSLRVVCARDGSGRLRGILPLFQDSNGRQGGGSSLRFLGTGAACSDYLDLIAEKGQEKEIMTGLLGYVIRASSACSVRLTDIPLGSISLESLESTLHDLDVPFFKADGEICPFLALPGTLDEFYGRLSSSMRSNLKRISRRFQERFGTMPRRVEKREELQSAYDLLFALHRARRGDKGETSSFLSEEMKRFHLDVGKAFLEKGWLRFYLLEAGEKPAGSLYCFAYGRRMSYYQAGFDPDFESLSIGTILLGRSMEDAISKGLREFDFLRGAESYKWRWTNTYRETIRVSAYPRTLTGTLRCRYDRFKHSSLARIKGFMGGAHPEDMKGKQLVFSNVGER